jgi:branched-chain amino acid transport system permease protein
MGAFIGGLSGAFFATRQGFISPLSFTTLLSEMFVAAVIIGGAGNRWGAIAGGVLVAYLPERFRSFADWRMLVFGIALLLLTTFRPQGIFPARATRRAVRAEQQIHELEGDTVDVI